MPSSYFMAPFLILGIIFLGLAWEVDRQWALGLIPCLLGVVIANVMAPQIDWWWWKKYPPNPDPSLQKLLQQYISFYQNLSPGHRKRFGQRLAMHMRGTEYMAQGQGELPEEIKAACSIPAVMLTFGMEEFLLSPYEQLVIYPKEFHSPQFPRHWHTSELFEEDHVLLFAGKQVLAGVLHPTTYFNLGLYEWARVFRKVHTAHAWPQVQEHHYAALATSMGFELKFVQQSINLPVVDWNAVSVVAFFENAALFRQLLPELHQSYKRIFNLDPSRELNPVEDLSKIGVKVRGAATSVKMAKKS